MILRPYQERVVDQLWTALISGKNALLQGPCAFGKSVTLATIAGKMDRSHRVLVIVDRQILVKQLVETFKMVVPGRTVGIACSGVQRKVELDCNITIATRQTLTGRLGTCEPFNLVMIDEAHLLPLKPDGEPADDQYGQIIAQIIEYNPRVRLLGCTATPYSLTAGYIYGNKHRVGLVPYFDELTASVTVEELTKGGYLSPAVGHVVETGVDLSQVSLIAGEYNLGELSTEMVKHCQTVNDAIEKYCEERKKILVFAVDIKHCESIQKAVPGSIVIHSGLSKKQHQRNMDAIESGLAGVAISVAQLSIGFDVPDVDAIILARPSKSTALIMQQIGRALRIADGKKDAMIIDLVGATEQHFVKNDLDKPKVIIPRPPSGEGDAPFKLCPGELDDGLLCMAEVHPKVIICPHCGYKWETLYAESLPGMKEVAFDATPPDPPEWIDVIGIEVDIHNSKKSGKNLLKVKIELNLPLDRHPYVTDWICGYEYSGFALEKGKEKWEQYSDTDMPEDTTSMLWDALESFSTPKRASVSRPGRFWELHDLDFGSEDKEGYEHQPITANNEELPF